MNVYSILQKKENFLGYALNALFYKRYGRWGFSRIRFNTGEVNHFSLNANLKGLRLPHVGFDSVYINNESLLFKNLPNNLDFILHIAIQLIVKIHLLSVKQFMARSLHLLLKWYVSGQFHTKRVK